MFQSWFIMVFFCFQQKTAYELRISDWSSDVCSSDLRTALSRSQGDGCRAGLDPPWARRNGGSRPALPAGERVRGEREVVVARVVGDLGAQPRRMLEALIGGVELDLRHHQAGVVAEEIVHFPQVAGVVHVVAALVDPPANAQCPHREAVLDRDRVVELLPRVAGLARLYGPGFTGTGAAHEHRRTLGAGNRGGGE